MTAVPHPPYFSVPRVEIKLRGRNFDTSEVIKAESLAVLNALTEHDFQDAFEKCQKRWETVHKRGRGQHRG
jgi:hypothetical protein